MTKLAKAVITTIENLPDLDQKAVFEELKENIDFKNWSEKYKPENDEFLEMSREEIEKL